MKNEFIRVVYMGYELVLRLFRPKTLGCRILIVRDQSILLVKHTYMPNWYLPGGGVNRGESVFAAAAREIREECLLEVKTLKLVNVFFNETNLRNDHIAFFQATCEGEPEASTIEIADARFFPLEEIPDDTSPGSRRRIEEFKKGISNYSDRW